MQISGMTGNNLHPSCVYNVPEQLTCLYVPGGPSGQILLIIYLYLIK